MNFNQDFYKKVYQKISVMESLEQVGLDLWSKNCSLKQQIQNLKFLTKFGKTLKEITFLSDSYCKQDDVKQLKEILLQFENLNDLCIRGVKFCQKPQFDSFFSYFNSQKNLKNLTLDISDSSVKKLDMMNLFLYQSLKDCIQLEELNLAYPNEFTFVKKEFQDLQTLLLSFENGLKYLRLQIGSFEECEDGFETFRKIINFKNLMIFQFKYFLDVIELDAIKDEVENVRKIKTFEISPEKCHSNFLQQVKLNILLQLEDLKSLYLNLYSLQQLTFSNSNLISHLMQFQLESFKLHPQYYETYKDIVIKIINMNKLSLKELSCYIYDEIEILPNLVSLDANNSVRDYNYLFKKLPLLVKFEGITKCNFSYYQQFLSFSQYNNELIEREQYMIKNNYYITQFKVVQTDVFQRYLLNKQAMLAHLIIYCQLIKPFIFFQADFLHWDLSIDL
ncbi:hypothetical protein ABPG74_021142 [Tetrahymena malaccensis]